MPLPSSGEIKLSQIRDEFGLTSGQVAMSSLYGKGNAPASGEIQMGADFHGTAGSLIAGSITRGGVVDKTDRYIVGRHESTPNANANIGSITHSTTEQFDRFYYDSGITREIKIKPNNATAFTKFDKVTIGGRTYTRRRGGSTGSFSSVGEYHLANNYQSNYSTSVTSLSQAYSSSPFTSSSAMSFTAEEDRSFFCDTSFTSGSPATQSTSDTKLNTSSKRDFRGFQTSTNNGFANNTTFGTQSNITITNPDFAASTTGIAGFYVRKIRNWNNSSFSGAPASTEYHLLCVISNATPTAPHPNTAGGGSYTSNAGYWMVLNGLKRFEITVGGTTHYYPFGQYRSSLLGGTISNAGFEELTEGYNWVMKQSGGSTANVGTSPWNLIGSGNTVNIKLY